MPGRPDPVPVSYTHLDVYKRQVQGPLRVVEGPLGLDHLLGRPLRVDWDAEGYEGVVSSTIKKYNAQIHTQSAVYCICLLYTSRCV